MANQPDQAADRVDPKPLRALIDTNVILDWLLNRSPWAEDAQPLWRAQSAGLLVGCVPASAVTDLFYIARRSKDLPTAFACVDRVLTSLDILPVDVALLRIARELIGNDFEDNVQIACARAASLDLIITRNTVDFVHAALPAIVPSDVARYLPQR